MGKLLIKPEMVTWKIVVEPETISPHADFEPETARKIIEEALTNEWAWCTVKLIGRLSELDIEDVQYLGCCSYENEEDFKNGGYYLDMQKDVCYALEDKIEKIADFWESVRNS